MGQPVIQVRGLGKRYRIRSVERRAYSTLREDLVNGIKRFVRGDWGQSRTEQLCQRVMLLPTGTAMDTESISKICNTIRYIVQNANEINRVLVKKIDPVELSNK